MFAEDEAVVRDTEREKRWPWAILDVQKEMLTRPLPNLFTVHKVRLCAARFRHPCFFCAARPAGSTGKRNRKASVVLVDLVFGFCFRVFM